MVEEEAIQFEGELEKCVLLVKHPMKDTIHPWWPYGRFLSLLDIHPEGAPLEDERGNIIGYTNSLLKYVDNQYENFLFDKGQCLLMGVAHLDNFGDTVPPTMLFKTIPTKEDLE